MPFDPVSAEKGQYKHFMLKEIVEQPVSILDTIRGRVDLLNPAIHLDGVPFTDRELAAFRRVILIGMGTSLNAAMIGRQYIERRNKLGNEMLTKVERRSIPLLVVFKPDGGETFKGDFYTVNQVLEAVRTAQGKQVAARGTP